MASLHPHLIIFHSCILAFCSCIPSSEDTEQGNFRLDFGFLIFLLSVTHLDFFSDDTHIIILPFGYVSRAYTYNLDTFAFLFISIVEPEQLIFNIVMQEFLGILCQSGSVLELSANRIHLLLLLLFVPRIIRIPTK